MDVFSFAVTGIDVVRKVGTAEKMDEMPATASWSSPGGRLQYRSQTLPQKKYTAHVKNILPENGFCYFRCDGVCSTVSTVQSFLCYLLSDTIKTGSGIVTDSCDQLSIGQTGVGQDLNKIQQHSTINGAHYDWNLQTSVITDDFCFLV